MFKYLIILLLSILIFWVGCCTVDHCKWNDEFLIDFPHFNYQLNGTLRLSSDAPAFSSKRNDLSGFTFDDYLNRCKLDSSYSLVGMYELLQCSDIKYFESHQKYFSIVLYFKNKNLIVVDHSFGDFIDTTFIVDKKIMYEDLKEYAKLKLQ